MIPEIHATKIQWLIFLWQPFATSHFILLCKSFQCILPRIRQMVQIICVIWLIFHELYHPRTKASSIFSYVNYRWQQSYGNPTTTLVTLLFVFSGNIQFFFNQRNRNNYRLNQYPTKNDISIVGRVLLMVSYLIFTVIPLCPLHIRRITARLHLKVIQGERTFISLFSFLCPYIYLRSLFEISSILIWNKFGNVCITWHTHTVVINLIIISARLCVFLCWTLIHLSNNWVQFVQKNRWIRDVKWMEIRSVNIR